MYANFHGKSIKQIKKGGRTDKAPPKVVFPVFLIKLLSSLLFIDYDTAVPREILFIRIRNQFGNVGLQSNTDTVWNS